MHSGAAADTGASSPLTFGIVNAAGGAAAGNVIFVTPDASYNQVSLQITLASGQTTLAPGTIPAPDSPPGPGAGTTIYVDLSSLQLLASTWDQITFDGTGWSFQAFADQGVVGMTPAGSPIPLSAEGITIAVHGLVVPTAPASPQASVYASYYNVPGVAGMYASFVVTLQDASGQGSDLSEAIGASLSADGIVTTVEPLPAAENQFALQFTGQQRVAQAGPQTVFFVRFIYGAPRDPYGYGALTDTDSATQFTVLPGADADEWGIDRDPDAQDPTWTLRPPAGVPITGTGAQSVVEISFSNVVTRYQPGPTVMLVSYQDVPGYQDGAFTLVLNKIPHVAIGSLEVTPSPAYMSGGSASVTVSWQVADALTLELIQDSRITPLKRGTSQLPAVLQTELTTFTLRATGAAGAADNTDYKTVQAIALPVINSFTGSPTEIYYGDSSHEVSFSWAVDSPAEVTLTSTGGAFGGQRYGAKAGASGTVTRTQMVTLAPVTAADPVTLTRRLVISAFEPVPRKYDLPFTPTSVLASPAGSFVLLSGPETYVAIADTVQYTSYVGLLTESTAQALAFSADGGTLAVACTDQTVTVWSVVFLGTMAVEFEAPVRIPLDGAPQQLVFSPAGPRIFVTLDRGDLAGQVVSLLYSAGWWTVENTVTVGVQPRGLTLDAAGLRLFVANRGDGTVTVIGLSNGKMDGISSVLRGFSRPTGVAATPNGRQLLVSCAGSGTVVALDPDRPDPKQGATLQVGGAPGMIAMLPAGAYAAVANPAVDAISLIDCSGDPRDARVAGPPVAAGGQGEGITASPDGRLVFAPAADGFVVVTLATYQALDVAPSLANHPTGVAVTPAGDQVFAWHDAQILAHPPRPGILAYQPVSGVTSELLAGRNVLRLVVSPDPTAAEAFAILQGDGALYRIATGTLETSTRPLGLPAGSAPLALAVSGEGQTLFVVAGNAGRNLMLIVLERQDNGWTRVQTLTLDRLSAGERILLQSTPDGTTLFLVDVAAAQGLVLRQAGATYTLSPTVIFGDWSAPRDLAILPDGSTAYVLNTGWAPKGPPENSFTVVDVASLSERVVTLPYPYLSLTGLQPSPDGRLLFATDTNAAALRVFDPRSLRLLETIRLSATPGMVAGCSGLAVMPDGSRIFTANTESHNLSIVEQVQLGTGPAAAGAQRASRR
jgi:DNA-binding beta-propeller fold protein YncE